jgi:hypothetical protein
MRILPSAAVLAAFAATAAAQTISWAILTPTASPPARRAGAMAFDAVTNRLIAHGGLSSVTPGGILGETWAFGAPPAAGNWVLLAPTGGAPPRWGHRLVRNTQNNRLITFGGRSPNSGAYANDTWEYTGAANGGAWALVPTATRPNARFLYGLAFDERRNVAVLFGGSSSAATFGDTWEYNGTNWTQRTTLTSPPPREDMVLVYDAAIDRTVLFGGYDPDTSTVLGDTWLYDGSDWRQLPASAASPSARFSASAVYDSFRKRVMLYGGYDGAPKQDTYQFAGDRWITVTAGTTLPVGSTEAYSGYDASRRKFVLFGGFGTTFTAQTAELNVPTTGAGQTGLFGTFAPGCSIAATPPAISAPTPVLGQPLVFTFSELPAGSLRLGVLGLSNRTWNAIPLPLDLGVLGFGSCPLHVAADFSGTLALTGTSATLSLPIPTNTALINMVVYAQGVVLQTTGLSTTPAAYAVLGN